MSLLLKVCILILCGAYFSRAGGPCSFGPSSVRFEYWKGDDHSNKGATTPQALVFENVMIRGNVVLMCEVKRSTARDILCTFNRGCQRIPELAFPGLRIANEKEGWIEGDDSYIYGEEKGCLAHYSSPKAQKECNLDPDMFGTTSQCQSLSISTPLSLMSAPKVPPLAGVMRLNGTTLRHVIRGSNVGLWWNEDFFHFYRMLTPSVAPRDGSSAGKAVVAAVSNVSSLAAAVEVARYSAPNSTLISSNNATTNNDGTTTRATAPAAAKAKSGSGIFSLKESALYTFRSKTKKESLSSSSFSPGKDASVPSLYLPSYIMMDSIIDYRNWSETATLRYEPYFSESRGAAEGVPNRRDLDGLGLEKHKAQGGGGVGGGVGGMGGDNNVGGGGGGGVGGGGGGGGNGMNAYFRQNKEWARALMYCSVLRPFQLAQQASNDSDTWESSNSDSSSGSSGSSSSTSTSSQARNKQWVKMQDPKAAYSLARLVVLPSDRCVYHGKVEPTVAFDERRKRFHNLRTDVHDCVAVNKSAVGSTVILYGRSDLNNRRWVNVFELASRIQNTPGVRLPVKVVERMPHTFREQVQLFSSAAMLITVHGAALVNVPFMPFRSTLVELVRLSRGESSLIRKFGLDAAVSSHLIIDLKSPSNDLTLSFNLLRQKLCDRNDARSKTTLHSQTNTNSQQQKHYYSDAALAFADMNLFCSNVTSTATASSLKGFASGLIASIGN